ncbi:tRNA (adenine(58)-n(1))-methyltransferase catalytic subunit trmt61a [Phtheirospermum japonicum]|uniref:tRNA (adenine(58)-N(1))-methyltransferase n=1 Tax=Phtheirospermum japonicum TaxID=374723 RepID=A0A830BXI5_9LAMI|nr:tRNA (adenine(58)-n(1))-methyltransferase catalytic subunit trmt61a [Phtheirospermum japonicum]
MRDMISMKSVKVSENGVLQNRFGVFKHCDWIGKQFGSKVFSSKGGFIYLLAPTPELWTLVLSHRTQILYIADISFVVMYLEVIPGCVVLESGTGSGSLTTSLARAVAPYGHVYMFDFHEQRAVSTREDFVKTGLSSLVTVGVRDVQDIRIFEVLLHANEVREGSWQDSDGGLATLKSCKKRQRSTNGQDQNSIPHGQT